MKKNITLFVAACVGVAKEILCGKSETDPRGAKSFSTSEDRRGQWVAMSGAELSPMDCNIGRPFSHSKGEADDRISRSLSFFIDRAYVVFQRNAQEAARIDVSLVSPKRDYVKQIQNRQNLRVKKKTYQRFLASA